MKDQFDWRIKTRAESRTSRNVWIQLIVYIILLAGVLFYWSNFGKSISGCFTVLTTNEQKSDVIQTEKSE
jgi:hypothetical protein